MEPDYPGFIPALDINLMLVSTNKYLLQFNATPTLDVRPFFSPLFPLPLSLCSFLPVDLNSFTHNSFLPSSFSLDLLYLLYKVNKMSICLFIL